MEDAKVFVAGAPMPSSSLCDKYSRIIQSTTPLASFGVALKKNPNKIIQKKIEKKKFSIANQLFAYQIRKPLSLNSPPLGQQEPEAGVKAGRRHARFQ